MERWREERGISHPLHISVILSCSLICQFPTPHLTLPLDSRPCLTPLGVFAPSSFTVIHLAQNNIPHSAVLAHHPKLGERNSEREF